MGIGVGDEKSRDDLPPFFIGHADDERLANPGEGFKGRLDFGGNDLFAAVMIMSEVRPRMRIEPS